MIDINLQETFRQQYNPDGSELRTMQLALLDILNEFDRVCRKNGVRYWLDSGTLLGAVRHGGFIPWDDDLDVCVLKSDLPKLSRAMKSDLCSNFEYRERGPKASRTWSRMVSKRITVKRIPNGQSKVKEEDLWLDVFALENGTARVKHIVEDTYGKCLRRVWNFYNDSMLNHVMAFVLFPATFILAFVLKLWCKLFHPDFLVHDYGNRIFSMRKKSNIFPLSEINFESYSFFAPKDADAYLSLIYGDYMQIPPEGKRETHGILEVDIKY